MKNKIEKFLKDKKEINDAAVEIALEYNKHEYLFNDYVEITVDKINNDFILFSVMFTDDEGFYHTRDFKIPTKYLWIDWETEYLEEKHKQLLEQIEKRQRKDEYEKQRRYETYMELKKEFENKGE